MLGALCRNYLLKRLRGVRALLAMCAMLMCVSTVSARPVVIKGSDTVGADLGPQLIKSFQESLPERLKSFTLEAEGSGVGIRAILEGTADITFSSRAIRPSEVQAASNRGVDLVAIPFAKDAIAVIANVENSLANLTLVQVAELFTGQLRYWNSLGNFDARVALHSRTDVSGTHAAFKGLALSGMPYAQEANVHATNAAIAQAVSSDAGGLGYVSLSYISKPGIKALSINGLNPYHATYPIARSLYIVLDRNKPLSPQTNAFIGFCLSPYGQEIIQRAGFLPLF